MKRLSVLGSTGSIGTQTLQVVRANKDDFVIKALAVNTNAELLYEQAKEFHPEVVCIYDKKTAEANKSRFRGVSRLVSGIEGLIECAALSDVDMVVGAIVGMIGVRPIIEAVKAGKDIALANKETLVTAGHIISLLQKKKMLKFFRLTANILQYFNRLTEKTGRS